MNLVNKYFYFIYGWLFPYKTLDRRIQVYKEVLQEYESLRYTRGLCGIINLILDKTIPIHKFPELYRYRPPEARSVWDYWWSLDLDGLNKRKQILQKIITKYEQREKV